MCEYKITEIIDAGLYTKDGEKVMDLTDVCIPLLLGEIVICKNNNESSSSNT
jgi:hypothetical protein